MRKEYDFSKGKRGAVIPSPGKTRITIMLDDDVLEFFRSKADAQHLVARFANSFDTKDWAALGRCYGETLNTHCLYGMSSVSSVSPAAGSSVQLPRESS